VQHDRQGDERGADEIERREEGHRYFLLDRASR
jgi:hypothetical protein